MSRDKATNRIRPKWPHVELLGKNSIIIIIMILKGLVEKVDNFYEQMGYFTREMETIRVKLTS